MTIQEAVTAVEAGLEDLYQTTRSLPKELRDAYGWAVEDTKDILNSLRCDSCEDAPAEVDQADERLCAVCAATFVVCEACHRNVPLADIANVETRDGWRSICDLCAEPNPRERGDDDGVEYADPRDEMAERLVRE